MDYANINDKMRSILMRHGVLEKQYSQAVCLECGSEYEKKYDYMIRCFPCYKKIHPNVTKNHRCLDCGKINYNLKTRCWDCYVLATSLTTDITDCMDCGKELNKKGDKSDHFKIRCKDCHYLRIKPQLDEELKRYDLGLGL